jgi:acyl carrier protein
MSDIQVMRRLREMVQEALRATEDKEPYEGDITEDLFLPEVLDSVGLAALIVMIENEWALQISDDEIAPDVFEDLRSLSGFVQRCLSKKEAS